jgi:hypothetical protein
MIRGLLALAALSIACHSQAAIIVNVTELGGDVVFTGSGTANTQSLSLIRTAALGSFASPSQGDFSIGTNNAVSDQYQVIETGPTFGSGGLIGATFSSGDKIGVGVQFSQKTLFLPANYVSGSQLNGSATFVGETFVSMGITTGSYQWEWGIDTPDYDTLTLNVVSPSSVPEPSTLAVFALGGIGIVAGGIRRRRKKNA